VGHEPICERGQNNPDTVLFHTRIPISGICGIELVAGNESEQYHFVQWVEIYQFPTQSIAG
jgi:hypothetical protein